jgi:hypothetical protein
MILVIVRLAGLFTMLAASTAATASSAVPDEQATSARIAGAPRLNAMVASKPRPLRGVPLRGSTGLRLLVANAPPFVLNVDTGRITPISGLKIAGNVVVTVLPAGRDAIVWLYRDRPRRKVPRAEIYLVRHGTTRATRLATAWEAAATNGGAAVWLKRYVDARRCSLSEVSLDGTVLQSPRRVPCSQRLVDAGAGAVLVDGKAVRDPRSGETMLEATELWAMVGHYAISSDSSRGPLAVVDQQSGQSSPLPYPSKIGGQGGTDESAVDPRRQLIALSYSDPAYEFTGTQVTDVWLLDPATRRLRQLPDMPAVVSLKRTSMAWASDRGLVMLAETEGRNVVAIWRPGQKRIKVRSVRIPARNSGSDAFIIWRAAPSR